MKCKVLWIASLMLAATAGQVQAGFWMIGDDDGYGAGIPDNANHPPFSPIYDGRSVAETLATDGAQYTDTYSTAHPGFSPQAGTVATFLFSGLGTGWTQGSMWFDMADFQASTFGAVAVTFNGIAQNWAFNDGYPSTKVRFFDLDANVLTTINNLGSLTISIDRNGSGDFYGFDYALLSDENGDAGNPSGVPEPASMAMWGLGALGMMFAGRKRRQMKLAA